ncbi:MAG: penicillin acylase family protein, partial [Candidatus Thermoplasmatota archaeon]
MALSASGLATPNDPCAPNSAVVGVGSNNNEAGSATPAAPVSLPVRLDAPTQATIKTDAFGVSHIYADDTYTLFYANGYVQARDRLFQLDLLRHNGYGDSAIIAGSSQLASDMAVRRDLYTADEIRAQFDRAEPAIQDALQAYSDGVNRFMAEAVSKNALPGEFAALGRVPEPWTPYDSIASVNYLIGYFGVGGGEELAHAQKLAALASTLGSREAAHAAFADLSWATVDDAYTSIPSADKQVQGCESVPLLADVPAAQIDQALASTNAVPFGIPADLPLPARYGLDGHKSYGLLEGFKWGSNALLIGAEHTATGQPMMFGGPQMGYYKPPVPYQIGLHGAGYDAVGIGVTSAPGIVIGRTPTFAWSVTSGADDQVDTVVVELDPADDHRYLWDGVSEPMECRFEVHRVLPSAGFPDAPQVAVQEICRVRGMPVVSWDPAAGLAWAQKVTTRGKELDGAWMWLGLARQTNLEGFMGQLATFPFTFNYLYAGPEGIAYIHTGDVPLRDPTLDPRFPALGGSAHGWRGEAVGLGLQTSIINPSTGYVAQWNNAPAKGWRTGDGLQNWGSVHRVQLLDRFVTQRLAQDQPVVWQDVADILEAAATHDPFARHSAPLLVKAARESGDAALQPLADALEAWAAADYAWRDVDKDGKYDDAGHAVWDAARLALQERVFADELGTTMPTIVLDPTASSDPHAGDHGRHDNKESTLIDALNGKTSHPWCDDVSTSGKESCEDQLVGALRDASAELGS